MRRLALVIHNVRSAYNVGSLLRTADGLGLETVYFTGYTPYPKQPNDSRLPHISQKVSARINKTALGAERSLNWQQSYDIRPILSELATAGFTIVALEQTTSSIKLNRFKPAAAVALIVGNEIEGLDNQTLKLVDQSINIPMFGQKESFNVAVAAAIALYHLRSLDKSSA